MGGGWQRVYAAHGDKLRFLIVGVFNTAFAYVLFIGLLYALRWVIGVTAEGMNHTGGLLARYHYLVAQWSAWVLSVPVGATTLRHFVFGGTGRRISEITRAYAVYFPGLALSSVLLWFTVAVVRMPAELGQLITVMVAAMFSYVGHKYFTFRHKAVV